MGNAAFAAHSLRLLRMSEQFAERDVLSPEIVEIQLIRSTACRFIRFTPSLMTEPFYVRNQLEEESKNYTGLRSWQGRTSVECRSDEKEEDGSNMHFALRFQSVLTVIRNRCTHIREQFPSPLSYAIKALRGGRATIYEELH